MAVAAYGSLVSLINVLHNVHYRAELRRLHVDIKLIESLQEGVNCLVDYVEVHSEREGQGDLWRQLSRLAFEAEEMFDLHVVDQLQMRSQGTKGDLGFLAFNEDVERVIQQLDFIKKELLVADEVPEDVQTGKQPRMVAPGGDSSATFSSGKSTMVGLDEHVHQIMDRLTSDQRDLQIIPIVGMGGIGKTTLAQHVFNNALIVEHFDIRIWLTISQEYSVHEILLGLLNDRDVKNLGGNFDRLGEDLYKKLFGRRYLIVMDDVWVIEAWNALRVFFPNNSNRSRVMVTTRLTDLASSLGCQNSYVVTFLDEAESWNLFCQTIFAQKACPYPEFEDIGRSIAKSCRGLPLEIVVIGSHLANSDMTKESWQLVAENMKSFGDHIGDYEHCMKVLYLSYKKLPIHLKLCFLYMRVFREDEKIGVQYLISRWVAMGFIKPDNGKDFWEIGLKYISDLIARNLIARNKTYFSCMEKYDSACHIHDLFRDLCLREWEKEQFIYSPKIQLFELSPINAQDACFHCGTSGAINLLEAIVISPTTSKVSLLICRECEMKYSELKRPRLVKAANIVENGDSGNHNFRKELVHPTQLRYAEVNVQSYILEFVPPMLQLLWNLQTLGFCSSSTSPIVLPPEIWEMPQLILIESNGRQDLVLPNPTDTHEEGEDFFILKNLYAVEVRNFHCTKEILNRIPNLKLLMIKYKGELEDNDMEGLHNSLCNLTHLHKLEMLSIKDAALKHAIFPKSLKYLLLKRCKICWKDMTIVGSLPNLEGLRLIKSGEGPEWTPVEGEFLQLKLLVLTSCDLRCWNADQIHFMKLEVLELDGLELLEEIPSSIGDIATLETIKIDGCSEHVDESAKNIWEEQQRMGNYTLQITIDGDDYLGQDQV